MRRLAADLSEAFERFFTWWSGELRSLMPDGLKSGERHRRADLAVVFKSGAIAATVPELHGAGDDADSLLRAIAARAEKGPLRVKMRLPLSECLVRPVTVPKAAMKDIDRIAALDLERVTPFRAADVHTAVVMKPVVRGSAVAAGEQIIVKRSRIESLRRLLESAGCDVVGADVYQADPASPITIDFLADHADDPAMRKGILPSPGLLAAACGAIALAALAITVYRHEQALASLREQTAAVRSRLADVRAQRDTGDAAVTAQLAQMKAQYPPVVALLDDVTRRMPDSAYVTEFRLSDGVLELTGFGRPVRGLPVELEQSSYVESASITAPIVTDDERQKERFSLQLRLDPSWAKAEGGQP